MSVTALREKDWVFNAFWVACGEPAAPKCTVRVPVTCLFKNGKPFKTLGSDELGIVRRINLEDIPTERSNTVRGVRGPANKTLNALRTVLIEYSDKNEYQQVQEERGNEAYICNTIYLNGEIEKLTLQKLDILLRADTWVKQVLLIQGFVPTYSVQLGIYSHAPKVRSKVTSNNNEAADNFARAIAKYAERAYTVGAEELMGRTRSLTGKPVTLKVMDMQCQFALDPQDNIVFLYADYTAVEIENGRKEVEDYMAQEKEGRQTSAAQSVAKELLAKLHHASNRGLPAEASFEHFDPSGMGYFNTDMLIDGLARLSIGVTYPVGEGVLEIIGGIGSQFVTVQEFKQFLEAPIDIRTFDSFTAKENAQQNRSRRTGINKGGAFLETGSSVISGTSTVNISRKSGRNTATLSGEAKVSSPTKRLRGAAGTKAVTADDPALRQLLPPLKEASFDSDFMNLAASQLYDWKELMPQETSRKSAGAKQQHHQKNEAEYAPLELPLPLSAYSTTGPQQRQDAAEKGASKVGGLAPWATKRSQRALHQLRNAQVRAEKKSQSSSKDSAQHSMSMSSSLSQLPLPAVDELGSGVGLEGRASSPPPKSAEPRSRSRGSTPSKSPLRGGKGRGKPHVEPLSLQGVVQSMTDEDVSRCPDELLHVDHGVIMTYRVLNGPAKHADEQRTHEKSDALRYRSYLQEREKNFQESKAASSRPGSPALMSETLPVETLRPVSGLESSFTLVILPDLFMTLDTLQDAFLPLLSKFPYAQLVLVGLPGMPNTVWPSNWVLNSDLHARSMAKLMHHLVHNRLLMYGDSPEAGRVPLFFMGLGHSTVSLSRFVTLFLPSIPELLERTRAVCMVNGLLRYSKKFKKVCKDLWQTMQSSDGVEVSELISSLHFDDNFLAKNGRKVSLEKFWSSRRGLQMERVGEEITGLSFLGVLEQLKGILLSADDFDGAEMLLTDIPVVVVQSSEDVFVDPRNAALYTPEQLPAQRSLVSNIADALDQSSVLVQWLQCGHEVVQERPTFLLGLLSQLAQICGIRPVNAPAVAPTTSTTQQQQQSREELDELFDVLDLAGQGVVGDTMGTGEGGKLTKEGTEGSDSDEGLTEEERKEKAHLRKEKERELALIAKAEAKRLSEELAIEEERLAAEAAQEEEEVRQAAKLRKTADRLTRTKNALDSKSRELKQSREVAMETLRKKEQADKDHRNECRECLKMSKEDVRSKYAEEYHIECQIAETSKKLAKIRAEELAMYRKEEAIKRVEESMARKRAEYIEERRLRAQQLVESIQKEELTLSGEKTSAGYHMPTIATNVNTTTITDNNNNNDTTATVNHRGTATTTASTTTTAAYNIPLIIETSNNIMKDLLECRQGYIETLKRQQLIEEKVLLFRKQLGTVETDERRLRRAIRLLEFNPTIIGSEMNIHTQLEELRANLSAKQETLNELIAVSKQRELQLQVANNSVQKLKLKTTELDTLMQTRVSELYIYENNINSNIKRMKIEKEKAIIQRDRLRIEVINHQKRIDVMKTELIRIKEIKGKLIDTDIYVQGVMQRCLKQDLKIHLLSEEKEIIALRDRLLSELNTIRDNLFHITEKIALSKRDLNKITSVTKILYKTYKQYNSISIQQIMVELNKKERDSNNIENKRKKESELEKEFTRAGSNNTVDRVRLKESDIRTKEERQFVGIDLVMNPEAYMHISIVEAEQMQFDEDYQCGLSKSDLERIVKLPEQIQLALPFLHTAEEVNAHKLLNIFLREKTESYFQNRDFTGELPGLSGVESLDGGGSDEVSRSTHDGMSFVLSHSHNATGVNTAAVRTAEIMHEILVRESLRDRLRATGPGDILTEDEQKWLVLDRILSPHVYNAGEQEQLDSAPPVLIRTVDNTLNTSINKKVNTKGPRTEKEKFDQLRAGFEAGEDVFHQYSWKCPFDRSQLLAIRKSHQEDLKTPEEVYARVLLDKYYVDARESTLGHSTLKLINHMVGKVARAVAAVDKEANIELQSIRSNYTEELDDATALKSGRSFESSRSTLYGRRGNTPLNASGHEINEIEAGEAIARIWGSWNEVHPASAGKESQTSFFQLSTFDASRDHPACFAARPEDEVGDDLSDDEDDTEAAVVVATSAKMQSDEDGGDLFAALLGNGSPGKTAKRQHKNDPHSHFHIADSIPELATSDPRKLRGKVVLMMIKQPMQLLEVKNAALQSRQSRSHYFTLPSRDSVRALDITVSIVFKGDFAGKGYRLGRLAAGLFRLPPENPGGGRSRSSVSVTSAPPIPEAVGYAPYHLQSPNLPDAMGRIVILHRPRTRPLPPGTFQIVVGAAANTKYSIEVTCNIGKTALPIVDEAITLARQHQSRLPTCIMEIDGIEESIRLAERKLLVCEKMIQEAELESERSQKGMRIITKQLERDDEEMTLMEDERRDLQRELSIFEIEYSQWASTFATRSREKDDIKEGIRMMYSFKRDKTKEKDDIKTKLKEARRDLPACMVILRNTTEAVNVAMSLNTIVQGVTEEATAATAGDFGGIQVSTPAEDVRRNLKQYGLKALSLEEQQWCVLDQALNPQKYEWQREAEEKERVEREAMGKKPKEKKYNPAIEDFRLSKVEIEYILDTPFSMLSRKEVIIRKLLTKYHDDREALQKSIAAVAYAFDPHLAERTRAKNPKSYTTEERNWSSVDRVLHPEIWEFYVNRQENFLDRHERESANANARYKAKKARRQQELNTTAVETRQRSVSEEVMGELNQTLAASGAESNLLQSRHSTRKSRSSKITAVSSRDAWQCAFSREEILKIWRTPRHFLKSDDEREVYKLLQKYNGTYSSYMDAITHAKRRQGHFVKEGSHIQWEKLGKLVSKDVDFRARQLLREIDRATFTKNDWISSDVLHANDQKFPTRVLRMHLEEALDVLLTEQIRDRERAEKIRVDSSDSEDEEDAAVLLALEQTDDVSLDSDDGTGGAPGDTEILNKVRRRAERREKRKRKLKKISEEKEVMKVKKVLAKKKTGVALAEAILQNQLGVGGCLACRTKKCKWQPSVDVEVCTARKKILDEELERVRLDRDSAIFESDVVLSVQLGGNRVFKRQDLVEELTFEQRELVQRIDLNNIDLELHDAYATRKEYFESKYLHGYSLLLWTNNARQALEMRQSRLCALSVAKEVVDDILDWMLEGWFFGERESQFKVLGYVPSIKATGKVRAGQDQISSVTQVVAKMRTRAENRRNNIATAQSTQGAMLEKAWSVEEDSQHKLKELKVARDGNEHEHMLNETETTLKFGIFMMTLMYFRAMTFLRREQKSWAGEDEEIGVKRKGQNDKIMTDERMRMLDEENRAAARKKKVDIVLARCKIGEARRAEREAAERREAILRLQAVVRRQKLELESISCIQKVFRGHIGRKAAKRWALKRAELGAMNALLNSTAIAIQRVFRGYEGRLYAVQKRTEMAQFIALMRVQESQQDEEIYWQTHPWSRFKKNQREWLQEKMEKYKSSGTMGGSRLSAAEQAQLEGRSLEEIRRQIEGLDEVPDEDDEEENDGTSTVAGFSEYNDNIDRSTVEG